LASTPQLGAAHILRTGLRRHRAGKERDAGDDLAGEEADVRALEGRRMKHPDFTGPPQATPRG
jgi:hypothetical protein